MREVVGNHLDGVSETQRERCMYVWKDRRIDGWMDGWKEGGRSNY